MCFVSLLLKVYFIQKPTLTVHTLQDIVDDPDLKIVGRDGLNEIKSFKPDIYAMLNPRLKEYEDSLGIISGNPQQLVNNRLMKDVFDRKAVLIISSNIKKVLQNIYPYYNLQESEQNMNSLYRFSSVTKIQDYHQGINRL